MDIFNMPDSDNNPNDLNHQISLSIEGGAVRANSRDIATSFGKEHRNVLQAIDSLIAQEPSLGLLNFQQTPYVDPQNGQSYRAIEMDRDGFTLLAMGFTGPKALKWKLAYIEAFNRMEAALRAQSDPTVALADPASLRILLLQNVEKVIALESKVAADAPKLDAFDRISGTEGSFCLTDTAKALQMRPIDLTREMHARGWIYRRQGSGRWIGHSDKERQGLLTHKIKSGYKPDGTEWTDEQVRVTSKGLAKLALIFGVDLRDAA